MTPAARAPPAVEPPLFALNLILFQPEEAGRPLPLTDARAQHILTVLRHQPGDTFDVGLANGPRGKGTLVAVTPTTLELAFQWGEPPPAPDPITLIVGLPRPQTARRILRDAAMLGVRTIHFVRTERGEPAYADSVLWTSGEWQRHVADGVAQAFDTHLPVVSHGLSLPAALAALPAGGARLALDNYESPVPLGQCHVIRDTPLLLAFGAERGWSPAERAHLRGAGFTLVHLGPRVLRLETAVTAALAILKARRGAM